MYRFEILTYGKPLIIKTQSSERLSLMCNYVCDSLKCSNSFLVPPIRMLATQYTTILPPCSEDSATCKQKCVISNIFNYSNVNYLESDSPKNFDFGEILLQQSIHRPEAGSYIGASYAVAVVCASFIGEFGNEHNFLVHFLPAADTGGYVYKIVKTNDFEREILHVVATDGNTIVHFSGNNTNVSTSQYFILQHAGDSTEIDITSDNKDPVSFLSNKPIHVIAHVKKNNVSGQTADIPFNRHGYNFVYVPPLSSLNHADGRSFTEVLADDTYIHTSNSGWPHLTNFTSRRRPIINRNQIPGDGIDNNKDGLIDEEYCGFLIEDIPTDESTMHDVDLDGSYNEDSACGEGMQLDNDTMECVPCPVGYYKNVSANDTNLAVIDRFWCKQCPDNKTTFEIGTVAPEKCIEHCVEGMELTSSGTCEACDIGFYKNISSADNLAPIEKHWNCSECDNNKTTFYEGTVQAADCITACGEGMQLDNDMMECAPCPVGYYKNVQASDTSLAVIDRFWCKQCPDNKTTVDVGTVAPEKCIEHCVEGMELTSSGTCEACDIGFYKNISSADNLAPIEKHWNCSECDNNKTTFYEGTVQAADCITACGEGMQLDNDMMECAPCPVGYYKNVQASDTSLAVIDRFWCKQCPDNKTTVDVGTVAPEKCIEHCVEGMELTSSGTCEACDIGFYKNISSADNLAPIEKHWNCSECDNNKTTFYEGTVQAADCITACGEGMQLDNDTMECVPCPVGYYKNVQASDTSLAVIDRFWCKQCPDNKTTVDVGTVAPEKCIEHCVEGMELTSSGTCEACDIGFYKNISSADNLAPIEKHWNCSECDNNKTTFYEGTVQAADCITACGEGMQLDNDMMECAPCPVGYYKNVQASDTSLAVIDRFWCKQCPDNKTTVDVGTVAPEKCIAVTKVAKR
ncbi:uncharacterized protein LOC125669108 [Ostrea edulis]|uniref:uncharacterized protein LOC125669108 n=1 Tax=Ostrea edulis TaxID=37623 RepID=UPI0024AE8914|nr:uncharacterized protein LOC125669108 [Ostrea edulis]